jgi:hypothetical protein
MCVDTPSVLSGDEIQKEDSFYRLSACACVSAEDSQLMMMRYYPIHSTSSLLVIKYSQTTHKNAHTRDTQA